MRYGFINNFAQALSGELAQGATSMTLDDNGALLDNASAEMIYTLTLFDVTSGENEIVHVTAADGNDLTVERGQEGTTDRAWPTGTQVEMRLTAGVMSEIRDLISFGPAGDSLIVGVDDSGLDPSASWRENTLFGYGSTVTEKVAKDSTGVVLYGARCSIDSEEGMAVGYYSKVQDRSYAGMAIGQYAEVTGRVDQGHTQGIAIGPYAKATCGEAGSFGFGLAIGGGTQAHNSFSLAIGGYCETTGEYGVSLGAYAKTEGESAVSIGPYCESSGDKSVALGMSSTAGGSQAVAIGHIAKAEAEGAIALGAASRAEEAGAIGIGGSALAQGAMAVGSAGFAQAPGSQAFGLSTVTTVPWSRLNHTLPVAAKTPGAVPNELEGVLPPGMTMLDMLAAEGLSIPLAATHNTTQVAIASDPVDLSDGAAAVSVDFPAGVLMLIDAIDVVIVEADGAGGGPEISIGPDDQDPAAYLAATPVTKTTVGGRETHDPLVSDGVTSLRVAVDTNGTGTYKAKVVFRGYVMEV